MDSRSSKPWTKSLFQATTAHRTIQPHRPHTTPTLKGTNSCYAAHEQWSVEYNRPQVVETLPHNQYLIRVDGSGRIALRNRRLLRKLETSVTPHPILSPTNEPPLLQENDKSKTPALQTTDNETSSQTPLPPSSTNEQPLMRQSRPARALSHLLPHNKPGLKELTPPPKRAMGEGEI